jgi:hypothetical protein
MERRTALRTVTCAAVPLLAGCTGSGDPQTGSEGTARPSPEPTGSDTDMPTPRITDRSFVVTAVECSLAADSPDARFTPEPPEPDATTATVEVTGAISGDDTCHTARLTDLRLQAGGDEVTVAVASYVPPENEGTACGECLVAIDYELTVTTAGARPSAVVVVHDGKRVGRVALPE